LVAPKPGIGSSGRPRIGKKSSVELGGSARASRNARRGDDKCAKPGGVLTILDARLRHWGKKSGAGKSGEGPEARRGGFIFVNPGDLKGWVGSRGRTRASKRWETRHTFFGGPQAVEEKKSLYFGKVKPSTLKSGGERDYPRNGTKLTVLGRRAARRVGRKWGACTADKNSCWEGGRWFWVYPAERKKEGKSKILYSSTWRSGGKNAEERLKKSRETTNRRGGLRKRWRGLRQRLHRLAERGRGGKKEEA